MISVSCAQPPVPLPVFDTQRVKQSKTREFYGAEKAIKLPGYFSTVQALRGNPRDQPGGVSAYCVTAGK
jgi:hypothetical protein